MARPTTIGAYMGLILGLGYVLFLTIYIYQKGLCAPLRTVWGKAAYTLHYSQARYGLLTTIEDLARDGNLQLERLSSCR